MRNNLNRRTKLFFRTTSAIIASLALLGLFSISSSLQAQTPVKGLNVTEVQYGTPGSITSGTFRQVAAKQWKRFASNGTSDMTCSETGRDEWSVYLSCKKGNDPASSWTLNLWTKKVTMKTGSIKMDYPVTKSANTPVGNTATNSNVREVKFYSRNNMTFAQARSLAAQNGWEIASPAQVIAAWQNKGLNAFAYGMTNDGKFCVPIQQKNGNFNRGANCGITGGNQGFLYVVKSGSGTKTSTTRSAPVEKRPAPPLTRNEMERVMKWISIKTSAQRLPFCWRQSRGRGAGKPMSCQAGYNEETKGLCSQKCQPGEKGIATFCYKNCPAGFRDDGLYCGKPKAYGRGGGYPWKIGDRVGSLDGARARCSAKNPQGCEKYGAIIYPKCKAGFKNAGSNICSPICPNGFSDIGVSCKKPARFRATVPVSKCTNGLKKSGALCYPACNPGSTAGYQKAYNGAGPRDNYKGVGPVCWQNCPSHQSVNCGAGCATTKGQCASAVFKMTSTPIIAALKIAGLVVTAGGSSAATGGASTVYNATSVRKLPKLFAAANKIKNLYKANETAVKVAAGTYTISTAVGSQLNIFTKEFSKNFGAMTSPEVEKMIDSKFSKKAALEIKREWAIRHLALMLEADGIATAKNVISVASVFDPTGVSSVVNAFLNPLCKDNTPFPTVRPKY